MTETKTERAHREAVFSALDSWSSAVFNLHQCFGGGGNPGGADEVEIPAADEFREVSAEVFTRFDALRRAVALSQEAEPEPADCPGGNVALYGIGYICGKCGARGRLVEGPDGESRIAPHRTGVDARFSASTFGERG